MLLRFGHATATCCDLMYVPPMQLTIRNSDEGLHRTCIHTRRMRIANRRLKTMLSKKRQTKSTNLKATLHLPSKPPYPLSLPQSITPDD